MDAPSSTLLLWTVLGANLCYGTLLAARVAASRSRTARMAALPSSLPGPIATRRVVSRKAVVTLVVISATAAVYYVALVLWLLGSSLMEPALIRPSWPMYAIGLALSICGLGLMGWTYAVFRSWRWRAEVEPGHQLMTRGPFQRIRHPIYLSFALFYFGAFFLLPYAVFLVHAIASFAAYDYRARTEEDVMLDAFGDDYRRYRDRTRRYVPGLY
jgi:protein-S-isoprenylcysteine O-methyltransferase Ste14